MLSSTPHGSFLLILVALALAVPAPAGSSQDEEPRTRRFEFVYETTVGPFDASAGLVDVFVPLAAASEQQRVVSEKIEASIPGRVSTEPVYGNRFWHGRVPAALPDPVTVSVRTVVERGVRRHEPPVQSASLNADQRLRFARFLGPNQRVVVGHEVLEPILAEVRADAGSDDPAALSRAIYEWVVDNVEYKKVGTGWGNGDTFWACRERYGNCTDFHALFISLARTLGIPARFEIGFPVPTDRAEGEIGGYHCWVQFYLPETGWLPIDASEAFKHPDKRELYFGTQLPDRIHLTTGRDLRLGESHRDDPLNYFVYPYVEIEGVAWKGQVERSFAYRDLGPASIRTPVAALP